MVATFLVMSMASYYYVSSVVKKQIDLYSQAEVTIYKNSLRALLQANEDALFHASAIMAMALERRAPPNEQLAILKRLTAILGEQENIKDVFGSVYGFLDGNFIDGSGLIPGAFFNPQTAEWLRGAILSQGVYHTEPYIDPRTGQAVSALSMVVFDARGESRGVLGLDFLLEPIVKRVKDFTLATSGFGLLVDKSLTVLAYPDRAYIGQNLATIPAFSDLPLKLLNVKSEILIERFELNGEQHIGFFSRLENGWYLGNVAPVTFYYSQAINLLPVILAISLILATILSIVLLRLSQAKARSEEESRSKSTFLARMSHEIRTPMHAIIGLSELAHRDFGQPKSLRYVIDIRKAALSLLSLIDDILDFSKIESGRFIIHNAPYQLARVLSDVLSTIDVRLKEKNLDFTFEVAPYTPGELIGDDRGLRQVLLNLLSNAVKYTAKGFVKLTIDARQESDEEIILVCSVTDSGVGVKKEDLSSLFNDFVRLTNTHLSHYVEGTGLGLSIARGLCQMMGGDISVESEYGQGSTFTATFRQVALNHEPIQDLASLSPSVKRPSALSPFRAPNLKVLLVDDNATNLQVAKGLLEPFEMDMTFFLSGSEAVAAFKEQPFELLIIDHMMPIMDGVETLKNIRSLENGRDKAPAIALTANAVRGAREFLLSQGFDDYISKPINTDELVSILDKWIPETRRRPSLANTLELDQEPAHLNQTQTATARATLPELQIPGFDLELGLNRQAGDLNRYLELLKVFLEDAKNCENYLTDFLAKNESNRDPLELAIKVHAIKSAYANIGAMAWSIEAAKLEKAALDKDLRLIADAKLSHFKRELGLLMARIEAALLGAYERKTQESQNQDLLSEKADQRLDREELARLIQALKKALAENDVGQADRLIEELTLEGDEPTKEALKEVADQVLISDFKAALRLVERLEA
ncbi:MAG: response regulator [Deltaproteobacteria bacterium]|nr:response regulator [Deltaproteobacteria bacterium]